MEQPNRAWHQLTAEQALSALDSSPKGLSPEEARRRLERMGPNRIEQGKAKSLGAIFFSQFKNVMIWVLLAAAVISALLMEWVDASIILAVILLNALLGTIQESRAEAALEALKKMAAPTARVERSGAVQRIPAGELVPGDVVLMEAGDYVPADMRLIEGAILRVEESMLTGESVPVEKDIAPLIDPEAPLGDRINLCFMGSSVVYGRGRGVVTDTGMATQIGRIASRLSDTTEPPTPLQRKLADISRVLAWVVLGVAAVIFAVGLLGGRDVFDMFLTAVSLAVAAIPEGLVAVVTIVLALGMQRMAARGAIIRKLPAVETLGGTQVICSDKTGTLTLNRMTVTRLWCAGHFYEAGEGGEDPAMKALWEVMARCNDVRLGQGDVTVGDPTETALVDYVLKTPDWPGTALQDRTRDGELPFDSQRKRMTVALRRENEWHLFVKGAPDTVLPCCSRWLGPDGEQPLEDADREAILAGNQEMAGGALRVLAFALGRKAHFSGRPEEDERDLVFIGLTGMIDPPREEVKAAVAACRAAGVLPVMITGDHLLTAQAIARELGILGDGRRALSGVELARMDDQALYDQVEDVAVFARVAPEHKVRIVEAWQHRGRVVAMTGDGVNDAPALKIADIGVGMGITGTDVSKGASDMVLTDDNFATIVGAVEEGRKIFINIKKAVRFLLSSNFGEVAALLVATLAGWQLLRPIHILWINLVTDTFPALGLGLEPAESNVMRQRPRDPREPFLTRRDWRAIVTQGITEGGLALLSFIIGRALGGEAVAMTMAFLTLGLAQLFQALALRSVFGSLLSVGIFRNRAMNLAFLLSAALQILVVLIPPVRSLFDLAALDAAGWAIAVGLAFAMLLLVEAEKAMLRMAARKKRKE